MHIERKPHFTAHECIVLADCSAQMKQCSGCIEKDRFQRFLFVVRGHECAASMEGCFDANCNFRPIWRIKPLIFLCENWSTGVALCSVYERHSRAAGLADVDAINRRGLGEQYQPSDRTWGCDRRHAGSAPGCRSC